MQKLGYLKVACLSHIRYHGVLLWNEIAVDWLSVAMWFGECSSLSVGMGTRGLVRPLFGAKKVGFRLVEEPVRGIKSPFSKGVCRLGGVGWVG